MKIESLYLFPVKSLAPVMVESFTCVETGPEFDRAFMVVDEVGKFVTQRELPHMALIQPELDSAGGHLVLRAHHSSEAPLRVSLRVPEKAETTYVSIFSDTSCHAWDMGAEASAWISAILGRKLRLVRQAELRRKDGEHSRALSFTDDYPLHIASLSSLANLNEKLAAGQAPLEILRFRPNIVVSGTKAWEEDHWKSVSSGEHEFRVGRACTRCTITTVNPGTGERGPEPLKTLATFRRDAKNKTEFGTYLHSSPGAMLRVGQELSVKC
jgi:uncharacterized protein YcbX